MHVHLSLPRETNSIEFSEKTSISLELIRFAVICINFACLFSFSESQKLHKRYIVRRRV